MKQQLLKGAARAADYACLAIGAIVMVFPFVWMILSAFKTPGEIYASPPVWIPSSFRLDNFVSVFKSAPFLRYFVNSIVVTVSIVALTAVTTIFAAFAFSKLRFPGRKQMFGSLIILMMVPFELLVVTLYEIITRLGLVDNLLAMILPFTSSIFYTYILKNFFDSIPDALYQSAKVDGASDWFYLWRVLVPVAKPSLVTIILLNAISCWNAFFWPLLVVNTTEKRTLQLGLYAFMSEGGVHYEKLMAAATVVVLPMILLFIFLRKKIISGVASGGIKG